MKSGILGAVRALLPALVILLAGCDDDAPYFADNSSKFLPLQPTLSRLVIYREPHFSGSLAPAHITVDSTNVGDVDNGSMLLYDRQPGNATITASSAQALGVFRLSINLGAGSTYYLRVTSNDSANLAPAPDQSGAWTIQWVSASALPKLAGLHDETYWRNGMAVAVADVPLSQMAAGPVLKMPPPNTMPEPEPPIMPIVASPAPKPAPLPAPEPVNAPPPAPVPAKVAPVIAPPPPPPPAPVVVAPKPAPPPPIVAIQPPPVVAAAPPPPSPPPAPVAVPILASAQPAPSWNNVLLPYSPDGPIPNNAKSPVVDASQGINAGTQALIDQMMH